MDQPEQMSALLKVFDLNEPFNNLDADMKNCIASHAPAGGWWYPNTKLKYEHRPVIADQYAERVRFSPSGKKIVTSPNRGKKCSTLGLSVNDVWEEQGNLLYTFTNPWQCGLATHWFNDVENKFFVANGWGDIKSYDFKEKKLCSVRKDQVRLGWGGLEKVVWTPDVSKIACLTSWNLAEIIDVASGTETIIHTDNGQLNNVCLMNFCKNETGYTFNYKICPEAGTYVIRDNVLFRFYRLEPSSQYLLCMTYDRDCIGSKYIVMKQKETLKKLEGFPKVSTTGAKIALNSSFFVPSNQEDSEALPFKEGCILYDVESGTFQQLPIKSSPSTIQFNHNDTLMFLCMKHGVQIWDIRKTPVLHATIPCRYANPRVTCDKQGDKFIVSQNDIYVWSKFKPTFKQLQFKLLLNAWWQTARTPVDTRLYQNTPQQFLATVAKRFSLNEDKTQENPELAHELFEVWKTFTAQMQAAIWQTCQNMRLYLPRAIG